MLDQMSGAESVTFFSDVLLSDFFPDRCGKSVVELGTEPVPVLQEAVCLTRHRRRPAK